jgi:hypothetical protein
MRISAFPQNPTTYLFVVPPEGTALQQNIRKRVDHLHLFTSYSGAFDVLGFIWNV